MRRLSALAFALSLAACGGQAQSATAGDGGDGPTCRESPLACPRNPDTGTPTVIAVSRFFLGDTDRMGNSSPTAWKKYGENLDGLISTRTGTNHCQLVAGANPTIVRQDGDGGIDNSFGSNIVPLITSLDSSADTTLDHQLAAGHRTILFRLDNLLDRLATPNQNGITGAVFNGADKGSPAAFDGTDVWPVAYDSVVGGDIDRPKVTFTDSLMGSGAWVAHPAGAIEVLCPFILADTLLRFPVTHATIAADIQGGPGADARAIDGVIAGVIDTGTFVAEFEKVAGTFDASLCDVSTVAGIAQQIRQASDIMSDGTNGDPTKTCDAISIGIGFEGEAVQLGGVAPPEAPPPDPCAP